MRIVPLLAVALVLATPARGFFWPVAPIDSVQPLGNNWGNYQNYGGSPYFHPGIDIITPDRINAPVVAVADGWVKGWGTISGEWHYRLAICDSSLDYTGRAPGWLYAHIDADLPHLGLGDHVSVGDTIGYLVWWPVEGFDHLHFARISDTGSTWMRFPDYTWWFIENPLLTIEPSSDLEAPVFEQARSGRLFAFTDDNSDTYQDPGALSGDVDIIARIYDKTGYTTTNPDWDKLAPYQLEYCIRTTGGTPVVPWTLALQFSNTLDEAYIHVVYKSDQTCRSRGDYERRVYYYIVTNTDGDSVIEWNDRNGKWATASVPDGDYWVVVRASDVTGNTATDSMLVTTDNGVGVEERPLAGLTEPLAVSPNPTSGRAKVSFGLTSGTAAELQVFDRTGRAVTRSRALPTGGGRQELPLGSLPAGVYFVRLRLDSGDRYRTKLVVAD